jgi:hypothetical protein
LTPIIPAMDILAVTATVVALIYERAYIFPVGGRQCRTIRRKNLSPS